MVDATLTAASTRPLHSAVSTTSALPAPSTSTSRLVATSVGPVPPPVPAFMTSRRHSASDARTSPIAVRRRTGTWERSRRRSSDGSPPLLPAGLRPPLPQPSNKSPPLLPTGMRSPLRRPSNSSSPSPSLRTRWRRSQRDARSTSGQKGSRSGRSSSSSFSSEDREEEKGATKVGSVVRQ